MTTGRINQVTILKTAPRRCRHPVERREGSSPDTNHDGFAPSGPKRPASPEASRAAPNGRSVPALDPMTRRPHCVDGLQPSCRAGPTTEETDTDGGRRLDVHAGSPSASADCWPKAIDPPKSLGVDILPAPTPSTI